MRGKILKRVVPIIGIIIAIVLIIWLILSLCLDCPYLEISLKEWMTIFLAFVGAFFISYYLSNIKLDYEKKLDTLEKIIEKMQKKLNSDPAGLFSPVMGNNVAKDKLNFYHRELLLYFRALNNFLSLISKYKDDLSIDEDLVFIAKHLDDFKFELTENIIDYESIRKKRAFARKEIDLIDVRLDEIKLKLH